MFGTMTTTQPMTHYDFGDVILVGFPFTNLQTVKKRPAVILSNETYNKSRPDVILMAISSKIRHPQEIGENQIVNWGQAGLIKPSVFKPLIATVEQTQVIRKMGDLSPIDRASLQRVLRVLFDL